MVGVPSTDAIFQSTLPTRGETKPPSAGWDMRTFQSTLPTRGETGLLFSPEASCFISIHSPHTGRDIAICDCMHDTPTISIHSPHTGRDPFRRKCRSGSFQSTLPTRGETVLLHCDPLPVDNFNPLSPHGERLTARCHKDAPFFISIHSPHTGRDGFLLMLFVEHSISIHSPHTGRDRLFSPSMTFHQISIHSPHTGRDLARESWDRTMMISIHSPHTGRDRGLRITDPYIG